MPGVDTLALDASGDVWVTDGGEFSSKYPGQNGIYEFNAYPSQTLLDTPSTTTPVGFLAESLQVAVDQSNGELFVANGNPRKIDIYEKTGVNSETYSHSWIDINSSLSCFSCNTEIHTAVDNSNTYSRGRIYLSLTSPEDDVEIVDAQQRPVDFPATASYISNNKLTGTPSGPFAQVEGITVDSNGNLFVADAGKGVVDEFDSSGTFLHSFPYGSAAVDPTNENILIGSEEFDSSGQFIENLHTGNPMAVNSSGYLYAGSEIFSPDTVLTKATYQPVSSPTPTSGTLNAKVDPNGGDEVTECQFEYAEKGSVNSATTTNAIQSLTISGASGGNFSLGFDGQTTSATATGNLSAATGQGDLSSGSEEVSGLATKSGQFAVGQEISGSRHSLRHHDRQNRFGDFGTLTARLRNRYRCRAVRRFQNNQRPYDQSWRFRRRRANHRIRHPPEYDDHKSRFGEPRTLPGRHRSRHLHRAHGRHRPLL